MTAGKDKKKMKKRKQLLAALLILSSVGCSNVMSVKAVKRAELSDFVGYYRVDVDSTEPDYNCEVRSLEYNKDGQLQEFQGWESATTGTTLVYRFTDYSIVGNVLECSYEHAYGYVTDEDTGDGDFAPLERYDPGRHQMVLTEEGNIISDGRVWYRYDKGDQ